METELAGLEDDELLALARIDLEKERLGDALLCLKEVVRRAGRLAVFALADMARVHMRLRLFGRAQAEYAAFLKQFPDAANERFQLGMAHFEAGQLQPAIEAWEALLGSGRVHPPALYFSAMAHARLGGLKIAFDRCRWLLEKVEASNRYHGPAQELLKRIEADPRWTQLQVEPSLGSGEPVTTH